MEKQDVNLRSAYSSNVLMSNFLEIDFAIKTNNQGILTPLGHDIEQNFKILRTCQNKFDCLNFEMYFSQKTKTNTDQTV